MNLQENISRIIEVMGLNESNIPPEIKRRIKFIPEKQEYVLKQWIMSSYIPNKKNDTLNKAFLETAYGLIWDSGLGDTEYDKSGIYKKLKEFLKSKYYDQMSEFYDTTFGQNNKDKYCFHKHSERHGGRGFSDCVSGWNWFLAKYGNWLPLLDWNEIQDKLNSSPSETKILLAKPLEGHIYEYYFSISKL